MTDPRERLAEAIRKFGNLDSNEWADAQGLADALLDAMREVAWEQACRRIQRSSDTKLVIMERVDNVDNRLDALERRVAALEGMAVQAWALSMKGAQDHGGTEAAREAESSRTPAGAASVQPAPAPEPSEEAYGAAFGAMGLNRLQDAIDRAVRAAYAIDVPRLEREVGERMVRRFAAWLDGIDNERIPIPRRTTHTGDQLAERFLKEGA